MLDSEWLADLARCGLLRASFIPPKDLRQLRLLTRYRQKLSGYLSGEKNRVNKVLEDCGIKLGCVVSDINGVSAQRMINALIEGTLKPEEMARLAVKQLRKKGGKGDAALSLCGRCGDYYIRSYRNSRRLFHPPDIATNFQPDLEIDTLCLFR